MVLDARLLHRSIPVVVTLLLVTSLLPQATAAGLLGPGGTVSADAPKLGQAGYPTTVQQLESGDRTYDPQVSDGLVAYWPMDWDSGPVRDVTGNGLNGTNAGATRGVEGIDGTQAFAFDGDNWVDLPASAPLPSGSDSYALSAWFKAAGDHEGGIVGWGSYTTGECRRSNAIRVTNLGAGDEVSFKHFWWCNDLIADTTVAYDDAWHHVVVQHDGSEREVWLDGELVANDSITGHEAVLANAAIGLTDDEFFQGSIDEVRVYNRSLSESEIGTLATGDVNVTVDDGGGSSNTPPTANDDAASVASGGSVDIDVLANDTDPDGDINSSTVTVTSGPASGTTSVDETTGTVTYTHDGSGADSDSFTYTVDDDTGATSNEATVSITVTSGNQAPTANDDSATVEPGSSLEINVLANDSDPDGTLNVSSVTVTTGPASGTTSVDETTGTITYTHDGSGADSDSFTYTVDDDAGATSNEAIVSISVTSSSNQAPTVDSIADRTMAENETLTVTVTASDPDGDDLTLNLATGPPFASFEDNGDGTGSIELSPGEGDAGDYELTVEATDGNLTDSESFNLTVTADGTTNEPPVANDDAATVPSGDSVEIDVLANDSDSDGSLDPSSVTVSSGPANGSVVVNGTTGVATYTHDGTDASSDSFTYTVADDDGEVSNPATVSITVTADETTESGLVGHWQFEETTGPVVDASGNGLDGTNQGATRGVPGPDGSNAVSFDGNSFVDLPDDPSLPTADESYTLSAWFRTTGDHEGGIVGWGSFTRGECRRSNAIRVTNLGAVDEVSFKHFWWCDDLTADSTVAYNDTWHHVAATYDGTTREIWLDGERVASDAPPAYDAQIANAAIGLTDEEYFQGSIDEVRVYDRSLSGTEIGALADEFDGSGPTNAPPTANDDSAAVSTGASVEVDVLANDTDSDGTLDPATVTVTISPVNGTTSVDATTGAITYTHDGSGADSDSFTYTVEDDDGATSNEAVVAISVTDENQPPSVDPIADQTMAENEVLTLDVTASDPDGDDLSLSLSEGPSFASLHDHGDGTAHLDFSPGGSAAGEYPVNVTATDGSLTDVGSFTLTVTENDSGDDGVPPTSTDEFRLQTEVSGLNQPTDVAVLPDGRLLVTQKGGEIVIADRTPDGVEQSTYMTLSNVATGGERGMLAIALDPDFESNGHFYLYYTRTGGGRFNRVSQFTHDEGSGGVDSSADPGSEFVVWENPHNTSSPATGVGDCCHFGGGLAITDDDEMLLTTGDEFFGDQAQDLTKADGKLIRVFTNGTIPADNPYVDDPDALDEIYAYGLRNPFRASWDEPTDRFFIGEVGGNDNNVSTEDVHLGEKGANYGWPECEGECENASYTDAIFWYPHDGSGASITGGVVYRGESFPSKYRGAYFYGDYVRGFIRYLTFDSSGDVTGSHDFHESSQAIVSIEQGPNGDLYYADIVNGTVTRVSYQESNRAPEITTATANTTSGPSPLSVAFEGAATDPDGDPLTYEWVFGDGASATGQDVTHIYAENGEYTAELRVSDGTNTTVSEPITIEVGEPPTPTITAPTDGELFRAGDTITFTGEASDTDGTVDDGNLSWTVRFLHNEHTHPELDEHTGPTGNFTIPTSGHDYSSDTGYRITLTATDSDGLSNSTSVEVFPDKVDVTFRTDPAGLEFDLDSIRRTAPYTHDTLIGFNHSVRAVSPQTLDGTVYEFASWSDGGAQEHTITVPESDTTLTANYEATGDASKLVTDGLALHLKADQGVSTAGGSVTGWTDQSGNGNDLTAGGDPTLAADGTPSGKPSVAFDGADDVLERTGTTGLPAGSADRTMFVVARYDSVGFGGVAYGNNRPNTAFGLVVNDSGNLMVQGFFPENDYPADVQGTGAGWLTHSVILENDAFRHYRDGSQIDSGTHTFDTQSNRLVVGAELTPPPFTDMDVSAVLLYDRALNETERQQVETYLGEKYLTGESSNQPPSIDPIADQTMAEDEVRTLDVTASDPDGDPINLSLSGAPSFASLDDHGDGTAHLELAPGGGDAGEYTLTVEASDGDLSDTETVAVSVTDSAGSSELVTDGLALHLEADQGVSTSGGTVTGWVDQSGNGNDLTAGGDPALVSSGSPSGQPAIAFDGTDDVLQRSGTTGLPTGSADRTMFVVARYDSIGFGGVAYGNNRANTAFGLVVNDSGNLMVQGFFPENDYPADEQGTGAGWLTHSVVLQGDSFDHYRDGSQIDSGTHTFATTGDRIVVGAELTPPPYLDMDVASVLVYDRALNETERQQVESYLQGKYR